MPIYTYECMVCLHRQDVVRSVDRRHAELECPMCRRQGRYSPMTKVFQPQAFHFQGGLNIIDKDVGEV